MKKDELTKLLIKSLYKNKNHSFDNMESKANSKKIFDSIMKGQENNEEIIDNVIKNLQDLKNDSNPFHDLAALLAQKYASSDLENFKNVNVLNLDSASDACVSQYYIYNNFGMSDALFTGRYYRQGAIYRTYLYFDTRSIPSDINITSVTMKLDLYPTGLNKDTALEIYPVLQDWREYAICWNNQPKAAPELYTSVSISPVSENVDINLTDICKQWYLNPSKNYGLLLRGEENTDALLAFKSKEYSNSGMRPRLEIEYDS